MWWPMPPDPWTWIAFAAAGFLLDLFVPEEHRWACLILLVVVFLWWGRLLGAARKLWRGLGVGLRTRGVGREPGKLYCPECSAALMKSPQEHAVAHELCPACSGKWCAGAALAEGTGRRYKPLAPWRRFEDAKGTVLPCPKCSGSMERGSFPGEGFETYRCAACDGCWFSRIDWVSFELKLS